MKTKEQKVKELVEWVARWLCKRDNKGRDCWVVESKDNQNIYKKEAKQILSHPDLYVEKEALFECSECGQGNFTPLAEALKEKQ